MYSYFSWPLGSLQGMGVAIQLPNTEAYFCNAWPFAIPGPTHTPTTGSAKLDATGDLGHLYFVGPANDVLPPPPH